MEATAASSDDESTDGDDDRGPAATSPRNHLLGRLAGMLGLGAKGAAIDPRAQALVTAAARDDIEEIDRLLAAGVPVDAEAAGPAQRRTAGNRVGSPFADRPSPIRNDATACRRRQ